MLASRSLQTVWTPLVQQTKEGDAVGILGLGGLGHMAVKFASALGRTVTVLSSSMAKEHEAKALGAFSYVAHSDQAQLDAIAGTLDFILVTLSTQEPFDCCKFFPLLRARGTLCFVGMCPPITADVFTLGFTMNCITTSNTGGRKEMEQMLAFCAEHGIGADVVTRPMSEVNQCLADLESGQHAVRFVLTNTTPPLSPPVLQPASLPPSPLASPPLVPLVPPAMHDVAVAAANRLQWRMELEAQRVKCEQRAAMGAPTTCALEDGNVKLTLGDVLASASWVSRQIWKADVPVDSSSLGLKESCTVSIFVEKSALCVIAALGTLLAGTGFAELPSTSGDAEVMRILRAVRPSIVLTTAALHDRLPGELITKSTIILMDAMPLGVANATGPSLAVLPLPGEEGAAACTASLNKGAFCVLTSGTSSLSKIVVCPHEALTCATSYMAEDLKEGAGDRVGTFWVYYYMISIIGLGACVFVIPDSQLFNPSALAQTVRDQRLTGLYLTPSILSSCLGALPESQLVVDFATLKVIWLTGEYVTSKTRAHLARSMPWVRLQNIYSTNESGDNAITDSDDHFEALDGVSFEVLDPETLQPMPLGEVGALHVRAPWTFKGYWTREGVTHEPGPNESFRTGDLATWRGGTSLQFVSREALAHVKIRGFKVLPEMVEVELMKHPDIEVAWCAAVGSGTGDDTTSRLEAAVRLSSESRLMQRVSDRSLRSFMAGRVPAYMVPVVFRSLAPTVGKLSSGKARPSQVDLEARMLALPTLSDQTGDLQVALPEQEARVAASWAKVLKLPVTSFAISDSFFDFGGSLTLFQLVEALNADFGSELTVAAILASPTLDAMAALVFSDAAIAEATSKEFSPEAEAAKFPIVLPLKGAAVLPAAISEAMSRMTLESYHALPRKVVLVTGCTGYVGAFVMESLARRHDVEAVVALVRAKDITSAAHRLRAICHKRTIDESADFESWFAKVRPACGDVAQERLGLSEADYAGLAMSVHAVLHTAAEVNMLKSVQALSPVNVQGTSNVLALCALARLPMLITSTALPLEGAKPTGYRQSKEVAEELCLKARVDYGVPSSVLQLGDIGIGLSASERDLPNEDAIVLILRACIEVGMIPCNQAWSVSIMPVNQCADMLARLMLDAPLDQMTSKARGVSGDLVQWDTLCEWMAPELPNLTPCKIEDWKAELAKVANFSPGAGTSVKRALMLMPAMDHEFTAQERRRRTGKGADGEFVVDAAWGARFGAALAAKMTVPAEVRALHLSVD
jgi:thioester reductase-like protein